MPKELEKPSEVDKIFLRDQTYETARRFSNGYDIHFLETEWRNMLRIKNTTPETPDGSFIGFVKWNVEKNGSAYQ
ncbi:hypothetical protein [Pelagibius sp. Alg239-R121]|uniref:hypothetical protein n=1 Tax=Pelagibius sp. Alg239-R121 TaxID=2993448 RepID=UPI0024A68184|nr:hypothetical protein [Pelagibius sp. Alg239-R121]